MGSPLSRYTNSRNNNFNLIRFVAATLVLYFHSYALTKTKGGTPFGTNLGVSWGSIAVDVFFITSGFLITNSLFERNNIIAFIWARILRIYPALVAAVLFCIFAVGLFFTTLTAQKYLSHPQTYQFLLKNIGLFAKTEYRLPGVFSHNPYPYTVNGSLWTLPYEIKMYLCLAIIGPLTLFLQKQTNKPVVKIFFLFLAVISVATNIANYFWQFNPIPQIISSFFHINPNRFINLFSMFFVGGAFYVHRDRIHLSTKAFLFIFAALLLSSINKSLFFVVYNISLAYLILYLAYIPGGFIREFIKIGDYSYGIYIYAFPVQQSIAAIFPNVSFLAMLFISFGITLVLSFCSWHLLEKKFLKMKDKYVAVEVIIQKIQSAVLRHKQDKETKPEAAEEK